MKENGICYLQFTSGWIPTRSLSTCCFCEHHSSSVSLSCQHFLPLGAAESTFQLFWCCTEPSFDTPTCSPSLSAMPTQPLPPVQRATSMPVEQCIFIKVWNSAPWVPSSRFLGFNHFNLSPLFLNPRNESYPVGFPFYSFSYFINNYIPS